MDDLTFNQLSRLCYYGRDEPLSVARLQSLFELPADFVGAMLKRANELGYVEGDSAEWRLTERGAQLAREMEEAVGQAEKITASRVIRPFTEFLPTGSEQLS